MRTSPRFEPQASRPGSMTAVMRTLAAASGPRIPRIAVVRGGRIVDEHLIRDAVSVTIGTSEDARIVVRGAALPSSFELLERVGDRYWLRFTDAMTGRIAGAKGGGVVALGELRSAAHAVNGAYRVPLSEDARGKVIVGDTTFLFQIVPAPPIASRPQLPIGVKNGLGFDWALTIIAAFSFLLHFGIAGAMYSDWMDPIVSVDRTAAGIVDDLARLPKPLPETVPVSQPDARETTEVASPSPPTNARPSPRSRPSNNTSAPRAIGDTDAARLAAQADAMEVSMLTSRSSGPAVQQAIDRSNVPLVDLSAAAAKNTAATHEHDALRVTGGGPIQGNRDTSLGTLTGPTHRTGSDKAGPEGTTTGPKLDVNTLPPEMTTRLTDADRVIASLKPRFRKCYQDGLNNDPTMSGKAVIVAKVAPNGEVASAEVASNQGLSPGVTSCLARAVRGAQFTGNGAMTTLNVPVTLVQQK